MLKYYTGNIYPSEDTIFVFGSNPEGIHGARSVKVALFYFGAIYGQGEGLQGSSYGLPTTILDYDSYGWVPFDGKMPLEEITRIRSLKLHIEISQMKRHYAGTPGPNYKVVLKTRDQFQIMFGFRKSGLIVEI